MEVFSTVRFVRRQALSAEVVDTQGEELEKESLMIPVTPERTVTRYPYEGRLFRISAGLEDADDLVADLDRSFAALRAVR